MLMYNKDYQEYFLLELKVWHHTHALGGDVRLSFTRAHPKNR